MKRTFTVVTTATVTTVTACAPPQAGHLSNDPFTVPWWLVAVIMGSFIAAAYLSGRRRK